MKCDDSLNRAVKALAGVMSGDKKGDAGLTALDQGILEVALMIAGLDGTILPAEYAAFTEMAKQCRGATAKNTRALYDTAVAKAGRIVAMARSGLFSETTRKSVFVRLADEALPRGFASGSKLDLRRAFAIWIGMGVSDGGFSGFERACVQALVRRFALVRAARNKRLEALIESGFVAKAERIYRDMATLSGRAKAERELVELISVDDTLNAPKRAVRRPSRLPACPRVGPTVTGWR